VRRHHVRRITDDPHRSVASMPLPHVSPSQQNQAHRSIKSLYDAPSRRSSIKHTRTRSNSSSSDDETVYRSRSTSRPPHFTGSSTSPPPSDDEDSDDDNEKIVPRHRQQWPYLTVSQPATPSTGSRGFPFSPTASSPAPELPASLAMTPASGSGQPSTPEQRYKSLFHGVKGLSTLRPRAATPEAEASTSEIGKSKSSFILRSPRRQRSKSTKRSESTGKKGLRPPRRQ